MWVTFYGRLYYNVGIILYYVVISVHICKFLLDANSDPASVLYTGIKHLKLWKLKNNLVFSLKRMFNLP